jgi:hypothetical protein
MTYVRKTYDLLISDEIKDILKSIESQSVVAKLLLKMRHSKENLVEDPVNFISISSQDPTRISYLTTERLSKIEPSEYWTSSRRFHMKPGGFVSKVFKDILPKDIEVFSNLYRLEVKKPKFKFEVVSGESIREYYHYEKHQSGDGSLGISCMRHESCQRLFNLYVNNPQTISLLLMLDENGYVMGRSLLWNTPEFKIMDRIYTVNDEQLPFYFKKWAKQNGYLFRFQQNWSNSIQFQELDNDKVDIKLDIKLDNFEFDYYPYMDTFKFFNTNTGTFSNYRPDTDEFKRYGVTLCSPDGGRYDWNYLAYDDIDNQYRHRGDVIYLEYANITTSSNNCNHSATYDQFILNTHSQWREDIRDYVFGEEYSHLNNDERINERLKEIEDWEIKGVDRRVKNSYFQDYFDTDGVINISEHIVRRFAI